MRIGVGVLRFRLSEVELVVRALRRQTIWRLRLGRGYRLHGDIEGEMSGSDNAVRVRCQGPIMGEMSG